MRRDKKTGHAKFTWLDVGLFVFLIPIIALDAFNKDALAGMTFIYTFAVTGFFYTIQFKYGNGRKRK